MDGAEIRGIKDGDRIPTEGFSGWLEATLIAGAEGVGAVVPCGECRACCTSAYFIHIGPEEKAALARIPRKLRFPAPGLPKGHVLLGYDEKGHCPMFIGNACSIYEDRPKTCRAYDCRIFTATGIAAGEDKPRIAAQAARWDFGLEDPEDRLRLRAVRAAARFLEEHANAFPKGFLPAHPTQRAVIALKVHALFLGRGRKTGQAGISETAAAVVSAFGKASLEP